MKLFVKYIYALGREGGGTLYEQRPHIDAFNQKRREIYILHIVLCGIMGPTNGKNIIHVFELQTKALRLYIVVLLFILKAKIYNIIGDIKYGVGFSVRAR